MKRGASSNVKWVFALAFTTAFASVACSPDGATDTTGQDVGTQTLGLTSVGSIRDSYDSNYITGSRVVVGATNVQLNSIAAYVGSVDRSPRNAYALAIYTDANGAPGVLVASSANGTLKANSWNQLSVSATLKANTAYWLVYNTNASKGSLNELYYNSDSSNVGMYSYQPFGSWPSGISSSTLGGWRYSIYATVTPIAVDMAMAAPDLAQPIVPDLAKPIALDLAMAQPDLANPPSPDLSMLTVPDMTSVATPDFANPVATDMATPPGVVGQYNRYPWPGCDDIYPLPTCLPEEFWLFELYADHTYSATRQLGFLLPGPPSYVWWATPGTEAGTWTAQSISPPLNPNDTTPWVNLTLSPNPQNTRTYTLNYNQPGNVVIYFDISGGLILSENMIH